MARILLPLLLLSPLLCLAQFIGERGHRAVAAPVATGPDSVAGLKLWLKADDGPSCGGACTNNATVTAWTDKSGAGHNANSAGAPKYLAAQVNGLPAISSAGGSAAYFSLGNFCSGFTAVHGFAVVKVTSTAAAGGIWNFDGNATSSWYTYSDAKAYESFGSSVRQDPFTSASFASWHLYEVSSAPGAWTAWINGVQVKSNSTNSVACSAAAFVGKNASSGGNNVYAEFLLYDHALSTADRATVKTYFANKYGLTIQ